MSFVLQLCFDVTKKRFYYYSIISSHNQNKLLNSKGKYKQGSKVFFFKRIFRKQKNRFFPISISMHDPKFHKNIIEIHFEHLGRSQPFLWNFLNYKKMDFFSGNIFDPTQTDKQSAET